MKKVLLILNGAFLMIKEWCSKHKKLWRKIAIGSASVVGVMLVVVMGLYIYYSNKYPAEINMDGVYTDVSNMDFEFSDRDLDGSYGIDEATKISVVDGVISIDGDNAVMDGTNVVLNAEGTYILSGNFSGNTVIVAAGDADKLQIVLNSCIIDNKNGPALYIKSADKVFITLAEGSVNKISDGKEYEYIDDETNVDSAIYSKEDLTINGSGTLTVVGNYKHGIVSKDELVIGAGTYDIISVKKAVNGKDCVKIYDCNMVINAGTDGICSNNDEKAERGFVYIENGNIDITSGNDGIQAETVLKLANPIIKICTGGGSANAPVRVEEKFGRREEESEQIEATAETTESTKGLKAGKDIIIIGGEYNIDTVDDAIHANVAIKIEGGAFDLKSGDDGIHADNTLYITAGSINIYTCYEGLEAYQIAIAGGETYVISSDDGVNASVGSETLSLMENIKRVFAPCLNGKLEITGGIIAVNTEGDGLDSNGVMTINGGKSYVAGPTSGGNDAFDCDHMTVNVPETEEGDTFVIEITKERFLTMIGDMEKAQ